MNVTIGQKWFKGYKSYGVQGSAMIPKLRVEPICESKAYIGMPHGHDHCPVCNGWCIVKAIYENDKGEYEVEEECEECQGKGHLDWIEVIVGKRQAFVGHFHSTSGVTINRPYTI